MRVRLGDCLKIFYRSIVIIIVSSIIALLLMIGVYAIPINPIRQNIRESLDLYEEPANNVPYWANNYLYTVQSNAEDQLRLQIAGFDGEESIVNSALLNPRAYYDDIGNSDQREALNRYILQSNEDESIKTYPRYWHGYLLVLKPMLVLFNMMDIRIINTWIQLLLLVFAALRINKVLGIEYVLSYIAGIIVINPISVAFTMHFSDVYYILMAVTIVFTYVMPRNKYDSGKFWYLFLFAGILTSFFDFLTYPFVTIGFPLLLFYSYYRTYDLKIKEIFIGVLNKIGAWGFGYVGMWAMKWIISDVLINARVVNDALAEVAIRSSDEVGGIKVRYWDVLVRNISVITIRPLLVILCVLVVVLLAYMLIHYKSLKLRFSFACFLGMLLPFVWYLLTKNHSYIHIWMSYRELSITIFAAFCWISSFVDRGSISNENE